MLVHSLLLVCNGNMNTFLLSFDGRRNRQNYSNKPDVTLLNTQEKHINLRSQTT